MSIAGAMMRFESVDSAVGSRIRPGNNIVARVANQCKSSFRFAVRIPGSVLICEPHLVSSSIQGLQGVWVSKKRLVFQPRSCSCRVRFASRSLQCKRFETVEEFRKKEQEISTRRIYSALL